MLAGTHTHNYGVYQSIADSMKVPLVDWEVSDVRTADAKRSPMTFSVRPLVDHLLVDYIKYKGWEDIVYIHDGANADRTLHGMFEYLNENSPDYNLFVDNFRAPPDEEFFREFLNDFHRRMSLSQVEKGNMSHGEDADIVHPVHVIVDLEGGYRMRMFLRALEESVLVKKDYHYVFANLEMEDSDLAAFHFSLINITGFQMFDRMDKKYLQNRKDFEETYRERFPTFDYLPASSAFAHDALLVAGAGLDLTLRKYGLSVFAESFSRHQLFNRGLPGLYCRPHEDRDNPDRKFEQFEFGDKIAESLKEVRCAIFGAKSLLAYFSNLPWAPIDYVRKSTRALVLSLKNSLSWVRTNSTMTSLWFEIVSSGCRGEMVPKHSRLIVRTLEYARRKSKLISAKQAAILLIHVVLGYSKNDVFSA
ncbi:hypothetical protein TELCIR_01585 [Teladorsagia circumcincta]|uniref:Receptor ligand binding region domain-containing protein n=1 Tax=Teladorsagia circumcincta TaxID=45464 RepID=A0A2G9V1I1_TELCI|nr:hypothetical protein TELCIR_01585 [Teladorsagia circumcincta]